MCSLTLIFFTHSKEKDVFSLTKNVLCIYHLLFPSITIYQSLYYPFIVIGQSFLSCVVIQHAICRILNDVQDSSPKQHYVSRQTLKLQAVTWKAAICLDLLKLVIKSVQCPYIKYDHIYRRNQHGVIYTTSISSLRNKNKSHANVANVH